MRAEQHRETAEFLLEQSRTADPAAVHTLLYAAQIHATLYAADVQREMVAGMRGALGVAQAEQEQPS